MIADRLAIVEPVFGEAAGLEILDQHVGFGREPAHDLAALGLLEIDRDRAFAAVAGVEIGGVEPLAVLAFEERRPPAARVVARSRPLDLDDVGAEVGERLTRPRPGEDAGEFDDFHVLQAVSRRALLRRRISERASRAAQASEVSKSASMV